MPYRIKNDKSSSEQLSDLYLENRKQSSTGNCTCVLHSHTHPTHHHHNHHHHHHHHTPLTMSLVYKRQEMGTFKEGLGLFRYIGEPFGRHVGSVESCLLGPVLSAPAAGSQVFMFENIDSFVFSAPAASEKNVHFVSACSGYKGFHS